MAKKSNLKTYNNREVNHLKERMKNTNMLEKRKEIFEIAYKNGSYKRWVNVTLARMQKFYWREDGKELAEEIVSKIMDKVINGEWVKSWDYDNLNIDQIMYVNIKSELSKYNRDLKKRYITGDQYEGNDSDKRKRPTLAELSERKSQNIEENFDKEIIFGVFERHLRDDETCNLILTGILNSNFSLSENRKISSLLKIPITDVENSKKRFNRKLNAIKVSRYVTDNEDILKPLKNDELSEIHQELQTNQKTKQKKQIEKTFKIEGADL